MKIYVASRSGNRNFALLSSNVIAVKYGIASYQEIKSAAKEHTKETGEPTWAYEVELTAFACFRERREVVELAPTQS